MNYVIEHIAERLKTTREQAGLSQRALSKKSGVPQSHISKIENGEVDLRVSSLIELARALDLELALVHRKTVPAVKSIVRSNESSAVLSGPVSKELQRMRDIILKMRENNRSNKETIQLQHQLRDLQRFEGALKDVDTLKSINKVLQFYQRPTDYTSQDIEKIRQSVTQMQKLRNRLAHDLIVVRNKAPRPAYSLEDDDDG